MKLTIHANQVRCWFLDALNLRRFRCLKPAAHGEERAEQTASRGGLLSRFLTVRGELLVRNWPREAVRKKSNMFDIFRLARQIPHCVRPL